MSSNPWRRPVPSLRVRQASLGFWRTSLVYVAGLASMLAGASIVHSILKPDLTLPSVDESKIRAEVLRDLAAESDSALSPSSPSSQ
mmetsp:Transcript_18960/g.47654  ORF Transcript_18960/g.47654 Transcript_18960/m.47654 type:complete len:86 (-) Transcript_18960:691-948(-)